MPKNYSNVPVIAAIKNLGKSYSNGARYVAALQQVNLQIRQGESVAIMGASGSGKSTLLHLMGCLDRPSEGSYHFLGEDVSQLSDNALSDIRATKIGFVFQSYNLIPHLNVIENVKLPFLYHHGGMPKADTIIAAIDRVGLSHRMHHRPNELSGGEMQRVAIARALAIDPVLILADEPTGNLDSETGESILAFFQEVNAQGVTLVIVTHDRKVGEKCQRIVNMQDGRIVNEECLGCP